MSVFLIISIIFSFILGIAVLVYYVSNFKVINSFMKYGILVALISITLQIVGNGFGVPTLSTFIAFIKTAVYTCVGIYLCSILGCKDFPMIRKLFKESNTNKIDIKSYIFRTLAVVGGGVIFSIILFKTTSPTATEFIKSTLESEGAAGSTVSTPNLIFILTVIGIVITEELTFRFVIPNYLAKVFKLDGKKYWIAIAFSSLLWALAHANTINPEWVKFAQIFPMGLALGWLFKKFGLESCIIAHSCFNIILIFLLSGLVRI